MRPLQVKVNALPGPYPQPARPTEEATSQRNHRPEHEKHRKGHNSDLTISVGSARVAVNIRQCHQSHERETRDEHTGGSWREVVQQFLQAQEVPWRFGRVWCFA